MKFLARRGEEEIAVEVEWTGTRYRVRLDDRELVGELIQARGELRALRMENGRQRLLTHRREGYRHFVSFGTHEIQFELLDSLAARRSRDTGAAGQRAAQITAFMPGRVIRVMVEPGAKVRAGEGVLILEAMKMENEIAAPYAGTVQAIHVRPGQTVESGAALMDLE